MPKFTDLTLRRLPEGTYFDDTTPGFGIRVGKRRRAWIVVRSPNRSKQRIGHFPALSLQKARKKARILLATADDTNDAPPFKEALDLYLAQGHWKASTRYTVEKSLRKHFKWTKTLDKITHDDVLAVLDPLSAGAASEALKNIRAFFNWCTPRHLSRSPCEGMKAAPYKPRQRILSDEELVSVWRAAETMGYPFGVLCRMLILTAARRGEITTLKWEHVRDDRIEPPDTKSGGARAIPVGPMFHALAAEIPHRTGFLFPASRKPSRPYSAWNKHKAALDRLSGVSGATIHDWRRTVASNLARPPLSVPIHITEALLGHVSGKRGGIVRVYQVYDYWHEQKAVIADWESRLAVLLSAARR